MRKGGGGARSSTDSFTAQCYMYMDKYALKFSLMLPWC